MLKIEEFLGKTVHSSTMCNNLINDLMDHAKIEQGTFKFYEGYFDLIEVINTAFDILDHDIKKRGLKLNLNVMHLDELIL